MKERARKSAKASLKNVQDQAEDQCKKLYHTEIEMATTKQQVLELKAELKKAKVAIQTAKEVVEVLGSSPYKCN